MIKKLNITPRWIIFLLDLIAGEVSIALSYFISINFNIGRLNLGHLLTLVVVSTLINICIFYFTKIYTGIIRYTSAQDSFRILFAVILSNFILLIFNTFIQISSHLSMPWLPSSVLITNTLASFLLLVFYRVLVKYVFMYTKNLNLDKHKVIIYGAGEAGIAIKRTFDHDGAVNKVLVGFIDDDTRRVGKVIDGVKIYHANKIQDLINTHEIVELIIASYSIPVDRKNKIVDLCLQNHVKVMNIPSMEELMNISEGSKKPKLRDIKIDDLLGRDSIKIHNETIGKQLNDAVVLVTGAAGSIGSEIVRQISKFTPRLIIVNDQAETPLHDLELELKEVSKKQNIKVFIGDVRDDTRMEILFKTYQPDFVYHAAAYKHVPMMEKNPSEAIRTNVLGTKTVANKAIKYNAEKFVMISTDKAVNPTNVMGASKRLAEIYVQSLNNALISSITEIFSNGLSFINTAATKPKTRFITTRFGNVLGSNGSVIPRFRKQIEKGGPLTVTHSEITRYFMTIPEACRLVLEAGSMGKGGEIYVFDMGESVKIVDLAVKMIRLAGLTPYEDIDIQFTGLRPGEKLYEELLTNEENTLPTYHEKIMIAKVREYPFEQVTSQIQELIDSAKQFKDREVVKMMKQIVTEFKSQNSIYEELDTIATNNNQEIKNT